MANFSDWYNQTIAAVSPAVRDRMTAAGFAPTSTGGGCMAWQLNDNAGGYWLVCDSDALLDGDVTAPDWVLGHYMPNADRTDETWVTVDRCTLPEALDILDGIRAVPHGENDMTFPEFIERFASTEGR
jgi:hypothetical protein